MAKQVITTLIDDLSGGKANETIRFGLDGMQYEIDLSEVNASKLRDSLAAYVMAGRKAGKATPVASNGHKRSPGKRNPENRAIREWGRAHNYTVGDKGVIPAEVRDGYRAAMSGKAVTPPAAPPVVDEPPAAPTSRDEYDTMKLPELKKLAVERGASSISRAKAGVIRQWLRDHPEGTAQAQGAAEAGREMAAKRASKAAKAPAAPDLSKYTPAQRREYLEQVRAWSAHHRYPVGPKGRVPAQVHQAYEAQDPGMLPKG